MSTNDSPLVYANQGDTRRRDDETSQHSAAAVQNQDAQCRQPRFHSHVPIEHDTRFQMRLILRLGESEVQAGTHQVQYFGGGVLLDDEYVQSPFPMAAALFQIDLVGVQRTR